MSGNQAQAGNNVGVGGGSGGSAGGSGGGGGGSGAGSSGGSSSQHLLHQQQQQQHTPPQIIAGITAGTTSTSTMAVAGSSSSADALNMAADSSPRESGDDSEDESEILEESPCGRWLKRREEVDQRDVPGIDCVHLAMDTEEGVEVVWNEVQYASLQELKSQEDKMCQVFDNLLQLDHQNIVKFHRYWTDTIHPDRPRVIFITEFMSSGSLKQFLKRTKRNAKRLPLEAWRRWCTQILSALNYLHSCTPPIIHGNLTCDSIFIQHNGLVKIGTVVPDAVHYSVRHQQHKDIEQAAQHFIAPEYGAAEQLTAAADIYAFGMCALEMAALEIQNSAGETTTINEETILKTINSLDHDLQRDLIFKCLRRNPSERPNANDLLFHPLLFEVHSLKLLAAHCLIFSPKNRTMFSETIIDGMMQKYNRPDVVMAHIQCVSSIEEDMPQQNTDTAATTPEEQAEQQPQKQLVRKVTIKEYTLVDVPSADKLEKFVEDVKFGVYPLTAFSGKKPPHFRSRAASPERADSVKSASPEPVDIESRRIVNMMCSVKKIKEGSSDILMTILLRMDDKMNRQLSCDVNENDTASDLTQELVRLGFVHIDDQDKIQALLEETLCSTFSEGGAAFGEYGAQERTFSATINEPSSGGSGAGGATTNNATSNNNNISSNNNNNAITITKTLPVNPSVTSLNQMERNWSIADSDAAAATASLMLQAQNQAQQQQQQQQQQQMQTTALTSPMPPTAAAATALGLQGTVAVPMVDPLAGHVMYVPHEQIQQQQQQQFQQQQQLQLQQQHQQHQQQLQQQQQLQHQQQHPQHQHSPPQHLQQQQLHQHMDPSMVSMDVVDNTTSHHQQQHQQQHYLNPAVNASPIHTNFQASPLPSAIPTNTTTSTSSTTTIN
ncbi:nuclear receptor-binding protein homolog [Calliphora vicina]|uniref:nuclear receptor-binding protein homolog n=1 Tax=Calliphora vicina TaxID=7373 RepID=UPI00325B915B